MYTDGLLRRFSYDSPAADLWHQRRSAACATQLAEVWIQAGRARIRRPQRGEYVFHVGDRATALFAVAEGQLHQPVITPAGG